MEMHQPVLRKPRFPLSIAAPKIASGLQLRFDSLSARQAERFRKVLALKIAQYVFFRYKLLN